MGLPLLCEYPITVSASAYSFAENELVVAAPVFEAVTHAGFGVEVPRMR